MNPSSSNVQCTFTSSGIALRGIPRHVISKSFINFKTGFWRLVPETHMMKVAYGGMVPRKYGLIGGDSRPNKCCCPMSPHGAGGPAKWSHDQSNGTRLTWKLRFKRIICSYVLPNLVFFGHPWEFQEVKHGEAIASNRQVACCVGKVQSWLALDCRYHIHVLSDPPAEGNHLGKLHSLVPLLRMVGMYWDNSPI